MNLSAQCGGHTTAEGGAAAGEARPGGEVGGAGMVPALKDKDPFIRETAASTLARIGPAAKQGEARRHRTAQTEKPSQQHWRTMEPQFEVRRPIARGSFAFTRGPLISRSVGRDLRRGLAFGYGDYDPFAGVRPAHPFDPAYGLGRIDGETRSSQPILNQIAQDADHQGRLATALAMWRTAVMHPISFPHSPPHWKRMASSRRTSTCRYPGSCASAWKSLIRISSRRRASWPHGFKQHPFADRADQAAVLDALGRLGEHTACPSGTHSTHC